MMTPDFGDLRALMNAPYSRQIWEQLCDWVHVWDEADYHETVLPYLKGHLHLWEDAQRFVPKRWHAALFEGATVQGMAITRSLNLSSWTRSRTRRGRSDEGFEPSLFDHRQLHTITNLELPDNSFTLSALSVLARSTQLSSLASLSLAGIEVQKSELAGVAATLAEAPWIGSLHALDLSKIRTPLSTIFATHTFLNLHTLRLNETASLDCLTHLAARSAATPLQRLEIAHTLSAIYPQISALEPFSRITHLDLSATAPYASALKKLAELPCARTLSSLNLWHCALDATKLSAMLTSWPAQSTLRVLRLGKNQLTTRCIEMLLEHPICHTLEELDLFDCELDDEAVLKLIDGDALTHISRINLVRNPISNTLRTAIKSDERLRHIIRL